MADWIARVVADRAPNAVRSADAFHVVGGDRRARDRTSPSREPSQRPSPRPRAWPRAPRTLDRRRATHLQIGLRALEETPVISPAVNRPTRLDRQDRPASVARGPPQKGTALCVRGQRRTRQDRARPVGRAGRADPGSPRSCNSKAGSVRTARQSTSRSTPASPKGSSKPPTTRSGR